MTSEANRHLIESAKEVIPHILRHHNCPGLNIAVAREGEVIWEEGFGFADLSREIPMTAKTVAHSGSMGKTYTATAAMQLVERGVIDLSEPINTYLDFKISNPLGEREITTHDLLTHSYGAAENAAHSGFVPPKPLAEHIPEVFERGENDLFRGAVPLWTAKVGERMQYSNLGMGVLGLLVERTNPEGLSYSDYIQTHIIDPLGMISTQYPPVQDEAHIRPDIWENSSAGYTGFGPVRVPTPAIYFGEFPAGGIMTTPGDHIRVLLAYLNNGSLNRFQLLKPETVKQMLTPQVNEFPNRPGVGLGLIWLLGNVNKPNFWFGHSGAHMFGWHNDYRAYPKLDLAVAAFSNQWSLVHGPPVGVVIEYIASLVEAGMSSNKPPASWAWKASYLMGLMMVYSTNIYVGIREPFSPEMIDAMASGAQVRKEGSNGENLWDEDGLRSGMQDLMSVEQSISGVQEFIASDRCRVNRGELEILFRELGGTANFPFGSQP
jgi:CubicO group peptidase (beta-lactamase class C family)